MKKVTSDQILDTLSSLTDNVKITLCYVSAVSVKKTKRSIDSDKFGEDLDSVEDKNTSWYRKLRDYQEQDKGKLPFKGIVRYTLYTLGYTTEDTYRKKYGEYKKAENELRSRYGIDPIKDREQYDRNTSMGISVGSTENTRERAYIHLNVSDSEKKSLCFGVNFDDTLTEQMPYNAIKQIISKKSDNSGISQLKKLEKSEEEIERYITELENIKNGNEFRKLDLDKILYMVIHEDNGEESYWVNDKVGNRISSDLTLDNNSDLLRVSREIFRDVRDMLKESRQNKRLARQISESVVKELRKLL